MPKNKKLTQLQKKLEEWSPGASKIIDLKKLKKANDVALQRVVASKLASSVPNVSLASDMVKTGTVPESLLDKITHEIRLSHTTASDIKNYGSRLLKPGNMNVATYCRALAEAFCDREAFEAYYNSFGNHVKKSFLHLAFDPYVFTDQIEELVERDKPKSHFNDYEYPLSFAIHYGYREIFFVPPYTKKRLQEYFASYQKPRVRLSPEDFFNSNELFTEEAGQELVANLPQIYLTLSNMDFFGREMGSPLLKVLLQRVDQVAKLSEFANGADFSVVTLKNDAGYPSPLLSYPDKNVKRMQNARTMLAFYFISLFVHQGMEAGMDKREFSKLLATPQDLIKRAVRIFFGKEDMKIYYRSGQMKGYAIQFDKKLLYPHATVYDYYDSLTSEKRNENFKRLFKLIKEYPPLEPVNFKDYIENLETKGLPELTPVGCDVDVACFYKLPDRFCSPVQCKDNIRIRDRQRYEALVHEPAYTNLFLVLASIGLFEITWNPCNAPEDIPDNGARWLNNLNFFCFGKIGHIRMTELGKYVFDLKDSLELKNVKKRLPVKLDERNLTIHVDKDDKPSQIFLAPYCTVLSHTLFRIDRIKFRNTCDTKTKVNDFFENMETLTEGELPQIWKDFRDKLLEGFVMLEEERNWLVFSLENMNSALVREIGKLSLQGLCVKMEGKRIAVRESEFPRFKASLEMAGFKVL